MGYDQVYTLQNLGYVPLIRDVVNIDKQDDISMATDDDTYRSLAAYLFVLGDLV